MRIKTDYYRSLVTGFYGVCGEKGFPDGFINKCRSDKIPVRSVRYTERGKINFFVPCAYMTRVEENALLSGVEISVTGIFGFLPFIKKHRDRVFLLSGVLLTVLFLSLMSGRVWSIKVSGNERVFSSQILTACEELGLKTGVKKKSIDVKLFQNELTEKMGDRLIWVSLNMEGMCAEIKVREVNIPEDDIIGKPCNYIADFDGVIKIYRVFSGTPVTQRGSGVHKGDLLISGVTEYETGEEAFCEARGNITAQHSVTVSERAHNKLMTRSYNGVKKYYSVTFFGAEIKTGGYKKRENSETTKRTKSLDINDTQLPFSFSEYTETGYEQCETKDGILLSLIALDSYLSSVRESFKNSRVLTYTEKRKKGFSGEFEVIDKIGKKSVIMIEEH